MNFLLASLKLQSFTKLVILTSKGEIQESCLTCTYKLLELLVEKGYALFCLPIGPSSISCRKTVSSKLSLKVEFTVKIALTGIATLLRLSRKAWADGRLDPEILLLCGSARGLISVYFWRDDWFESDSELGLIMNFKFLWLDRF